MTTNKEKNLINATVDLVRILEKEKGQSLNAKLYRWKDENKQHAGVIKLIDQIEDVVGIENSKIETQALLSVYLRKLFQESSKEPESLHEIWKCNGKGVLIRDAKTLEPFTLTDEFNDGLCLRYIVTRIDRTKRLMDADEKNWLVIF